MATELSQEHRLELGCVAPGALLHSSRLLWSVAGSPLSLHPVCLGRGPHPLGREPLALPAFTSNAMGDKTHGVYTERKGAVRVTGWQVHTMSSPHGTLCICGAQLPMRVAQLSILTRPGPEGLM